jgi:PAS domain S-box-containing protein
LINYARNNEGNFELSDLYENAPCGYHSVVADGTIVRMNQTELTWLGFTREELVGKRKFADLISLRCDRDYSRTFAALSAGQDISEIETELVRKDGSTFDAFLRIAAVRDGRRRFLQTRATVIDITARKRAETEVRVYAEKLQAISQRVVEIQEKERRNLSAELHDRIGQDLAMISLNLHIIKDQIPDELRTRLGRRLDDSIGLVERTVEVVRDVAGTLRPLVLDDYGLTVTLRSYGEQFTARTGIRVTVEAKQSVPRLPQEAEMTLFRITQEALTNVLKHAKATKVGVILEVDTESVYLTIADNGRGCDAGCADNHVAKGLGLLTMQERLRAVNGSMRIESQPGAGMKVIARVGRSA